MKDTDKPMVDMPTLRKDLYLVMSLLLADKEVAKVKGAVDWTQDFYENEVRRLMLWAAAALRGLLDLLPEKNSIKTEFCGEYWDNFPSGKERELQFRQVCNSIIHAKTILAYKIPMRELEKTVVRVYENRITIKSTHRGKKTLAQLDIIRFVQIAHILINYFEENDMPTNRDTYKYHFKKGNKIIYAGITYDLDRREVEHQREPGKSRGHIKQVGFRTTRDAARKWEQEQAKQGRPVRKE